MKRSAVVLALALAGVSTLAQQPPALEAVSIKPNTSGSASSGGLLPQRGRFAATNVTLRELITYAYRVRPFQLEGLPDWATRERYDVASRTQGGQLATPPMLVPALEERFGLKVTRQTHQRPIYALVKARGDGKMGPGLVVSTNPCDPARTDVPPCRMMFRQDLIEATGMDIRTLSPQLIGVVGRLIVDRTGLEGRFDVSLKWTPDLSLGGENPAGVERVSLFTALEEQLGLRLQPDTGPVDVLVIESVSRPTSD
jgi:uncharacterized protein (TIGR03435 family)